MSPCSSIVEKQVRGVACGCGKFCHASSAFWTRSPAVKLRTTLKDDGNLSCFLTAEPSSSFLREGEKEREREEGE